MGISDSVTAQQGQSTGQEPFPLNRVVAFLGPFLAIASGALAAWLIEHIPGLHTDKATLASNITAAIVFLVGAGGTFVMHHKWLSGWQAWEHSVNEAANLPAPDLMPSGAYDPSEFAAAPLGSSGESAAAASSGDVTSAAGLDASGVQTTTGELPPPTVDPGPGQPADQTGDTPILPGGEQELESVPDAVNGAAASPLPETAVQPNAPTDEIGDTPILPDGEQDLESAPDAVNGAAASSLPETAAKPDAPTDEIEPAEV